MDHVGVRLSIDRTAVDDRVSECVPPVLEREDRAVSRLSAAGEDHLREDVGLCFAGAVGDVPGTHTLPTNVYPTSDMQLMYFYDTSIV